MAQRTGADGFLASKAKTKSAAFAALLAAAALALSGCGGDDSAEKTGTAGAAQPAAGQAGQGSAPANADPSSQAKEGQGGGTPQGSSAQAPGEEGKHGQRIVLPKGSPEPAATPAERAQATIASITLTSPALSAAPEAAAELPSTYTCDGKDSWPELRWSGVPQGTAELALFVMNTQPVNEELFFDWAVAGIDPALEEIEAAKLPKGAVQGKNNFGQSTYSICPAKGTSETYIFALYAFPKRLSAAKGFDPFELRKQILAQAGNVGLWAVSYGR